MLDSYGVHIYIGALLLALFIRQQVDNPCGRLQKGDLLCTSQPRGSLFALATFLRLMSCVSCITTLLEFSLWTFSVVLVCSIVIFWGHVTLRVNRSLSEMCPMLDCSWVSCQKHGLLCPGALMTMKLSETLESYCWNESVPCRSKILYFTKPFPRMLMRRKAGCSEHQLLFLVWPRKRKALAACQQTLVLFATCKGSQDKSQCIFLELTPKGCLYVPAFTDCTLQKHVLKIFFFFF